MTLIKYYIKKILNQIVSSSAHFKLCPNSLKPGILICQCRSQVQLCHNYKWFSFCLWAHVVSVPYSILTDLNILWVCPTVSWQTWIYCECAYSILTDLNILWVCLQYLDRLEYIVSVPYSIFTNLNLLWVCPKLSWQTWIYCECALQYLQTWI